MSGEDEASIRYYGLLKSMGDTYGFIKCKRTQELYNRDVYITKSDLPDGGEVSKPVSFQVHLNDRGRPQAREVRVEETMPEESEEEQPEELQKAHSAPLPSTKSPPSSSPPRSMELKPLSAPIAPWADIVDDEDFEPLEVQTLQTEVKADIEEDDDGLGEWGRRRRSMSLPEKPTKSIEEKPMDRQVAVSDSSSPSNNELSPTESAEQPSNSTDDGGNDETNGLLQRLLGVDSDQQEEKNTQVRTPAVGLPLGAPPSANKRWGGDSGDESEVLMQDMDMGALSPGSDAIWRTQDSDPFYQQVLMEAAPMCPPMQVPQVPQAQMPQAAVPQGMPQAMPHTGMSQTTMASMTQPAMMCEAPQIEGHTWAPWQNWNSWTESADGTWQYNAMPCGCGAPNGAPPEPQPAPQQMWPQDATWPQQGETQQWQEQQEQQQPTQTWQREPGHEILKQLGVTPAGPPEPPVHEENLFLPEALWNRTDIVRALCFKRSRRFLIGAESDIMRLLKAPEGALLRIPKLAPLYQRLLRELCKRFRVREETTPTGEFIIRTTNSSYAPLMPLAAFVPRTWGGSNPNAWKERHRDPAVLRGKHNVTPCPGLLVPPSQINMYDEFGPGAPGDDLGNLGGFGAHRWDMRESEQAQWDMPLLAKQWRFIELPSTQCSAQDDGMVVTVSLNLMQGGGGFGLALCEQGGAFQEPLSRLLDNIHGDGRHAQRPSRPAGNFHVLLVQPSQSGPSPTGEPRWCLKLGHGEQAVQGEYADCRTVAWQDEGRIVTNSGKHSATFWLATYAGGSIQGLDDGGMLVEAGIGRFPWGKIFRARVQRSGVLRKVAVGALGRSQGTHLSAVSLESSVCPDLASREHVVKLFRNGKKGGAAERSPWWLQPGKHGLVALFDSLAICESADAALRLQRTAEECSNGAWQAKTLAGASIEEAVGGQYGNCGLQREQRAMALLGLGRQSAIDLALDEWAAVAEESKKALLPEPPSMAPPPPPSAVPPPPPASQQPHWPTPTPPPPPPISRLSADAPIFTPGGQMEPEKPALSCSALPFIPSESTRAMAEMASNMNASAEEFMPTLMNQVDKSWEEEAWKEPWKPEVQTWNDRKWAQHETHRYDEGEYMKGDPKSKGWGKGKGRMNNGKGQNWNTNNNTTWKGSNNRGMSGAQYGQHGQHGQHNTQHNTQHNSQHNGHRRPNEWNDWEEHWDDWEEKEWSDEAWRSQWRGAEPNKPNKWAQERRNSNRQERQMPKTQRPPLRQRKYSDSTEVISSASSNSKGDEIPKGRGRGGKGQEVAPAVPQRAKLRRMAQEQREAERAARDKKNRQDEVVESSPKAAVDIDKSAVWRHLGRKSALSHAL